MDLPYLINTARENVEIPKLPSQLRFHPPEAAFSAYINTFCR